MTNDEAPNEELRVNDLRSPRYLSLLCLETRNRSFRILAIRTHNDWHLIVRPTELANLFLDLP